MGAIELWRVAWLYHFFGLPVLSGWGPIRSLGLNRPARGFDWAVRDEIAGVLRCIRPGRHGGGLPYWSSRGAVVGGSEFARVPCVFLFCFLGRLAVGRESDLNLAGSLASPRLFRNRRHTWWVSPFRDEAKRLEIWRNVMTDPRFTDPRLSDPVIRRDESAAGGMWGWIAGVAVLLLIGFLIVAGWNNNSTTASKGSSSTTTSSSTAPRTTTPSTTGSGATSTQPLSPPASTPSTPPPPKSQ